MNASLRAFAGASLVLVSATALAQQVAPMPPSTAVASQGGAQVTLADIDAFVARIPEKERPVFFMSPKRTESLITNLLFTKQFAAQAREQGLEKDPDVQRQIALAVDEVLTRARTNQLRDAATLPNPELMAKEEYIGHKEDYALKASRDVKHILVSTKDRSDEEAHALADKIAKEAKAAPDQFDALVAKYSDDQSKQVNHGVMTDATADTYVAEFGAAAKALEKVGDISDPVKTKYGYHILQLARVQTPRQLTFEEAKPTIVKHLAEQYVEKSVQTRSDEVRNLPLDANPAAVESLRTRYGTPPSIEDAKAAEGK
jgi:parvulin-like peptidyl-prolyl isomerase